MSHWDDLKGLSIDLSHLTPEQVDEKFKKVSDIEIDEVLKVLEGAMNQVTAREKVIQSVIAVARLVAKLALA